MNKYSAKIPCIPVRSEARSASEMVTQLIYGEPYIILSESAEWLEIKSVNDGYTGFISSNQHHSYPSFRGSPILTRFRLVNGVPYTLGSLIENETSKNQNFDLCGIAEELLGAPYLWGGKTFMGIDCSGLVQVTARCLGLELPRDAKDQINEGEGVEFESRKRNDLAFFENLERRITHVGILVSPDRIIHASGTVRYDRFNQEGIWREGQDLEEKTHVLHSLRRIIE